MAKMLCLAMYAKSRMNNLKKEKIKTKLCEMLKLTLEDA